MTTDSSAATPRPPRGPSLAAILIASGVALVALALGVALGPWAQAQFAGDDDRATGDGETWYISQMHPWIIQREPGTCPICGMDLTPIDPDEYLGELTIDPTVVQNIGIRTALAEEDRLERRIRSVGVVAVDPERVHDVVVRAEGWVASVAVAAQWAPVERGQLLFELVSPRLNTALREARLAAANDDAELMAVLRERLRFFGLDADTIDELLATDQLPEAIGVRAPVDGVVLTPPVSAGARLTGTTVTHRIAALDPIWVEVAIAEHDLPFVRPGQAVEVVFPRADLEPRSGTIARLYPVVDARTRTATARVVLANPDGVLHPGLYAIAEIVAHGEEPAVLIPETATIGIGERRTAFVALGEGRFEPRDVVLGERGSDGLVAVREGIVAGESVVTSGQFLLDSESDKRAAIVRMMRGDLAAVESGDAGGGITIDAAARTQLAAALGSYLELQAALYAHDAAAASEHAAATDERLRTLLADLRAGDVHADHRLTMLADIERALAQLAAAEAELGDLRVAFGALSIPLIALLDEVGVPAAIESELQALHCSMAKGVPDGGRWIQPYGAVRNPFFGAEAGMAACAASDRILPRSKDTGAGTPDAAGETAAVPEDPAGDDETVPERSDLPADDPAEAGVPPPPGERIMRALATVGDALYHEDMVEIQTTAAELTNQLALDADWSGHDHLALTIHTAADLASARLAYSELSAIVYRSLAEGAPALDLGESVFLYRCGMARGVVEQGLWLQLDDEAPRNPYYGADHAMADCAIAGWRVTSDGVAELDW